MFSKFLKSDRVFKPSEIEEVLKMSVLCLKPIKNNRGKECYNIPAAFDIETSSFYYNSEKTAIMYEWTLGINGLVIVGRTWEEFLTVCNTITEKLQLGADKHLIIYVHNLSYEFQFMRKYFTWEKVFSIDVRKPIYAITDSGLEFRCSYILSSYSLAKLGENLNKYKVSKMVGDLDYKKIRHSKTPLTEKELGYCINDVKVVMSYIKEQIEDTGSITRLPLTNTGYVRNYCRTSCFYEQGVPRNKSYKRLKYMELMNALTLEPEEYKQLKRAFQGGFTHANPFYTNKVVDNVASFDFTSSYPSVMIAEQFPMSKGELITLTSKQEFYDNLKYYCCLFDIQFINIRPKVFYENYISISRCWGKSNYISNNGRLVSADEIYTTITEQDFFIISKFYEWDKIKITNFRRYKKGYLPSDLVKAILKLYQDKTQLKGVQGKEVEYLKSKGMLNSTYGMAVTNIIRDEILYIEDWDTEAPDIKTTIEKYNNDKNRFLFYPWGVWVTAYARRNLFSGIMELKEDYIYSDTDSIKGLNMANHAAYIENYNKVITEQLARALEYHGLDKNLTAPATIKGVKKPLGVWDYEGTYDKFKTLGAKRYLVYKDGKYEMTVSGLNKKIAVPYMLEKWGSDIFNHFTEDLYIPAGYTGKNTHTYIDSERQGIIEDYTGITEEFHELTGVHLEEADYNLSITQEYKNYILQIQEEF